MERVAHCQCGSLRAITAGELDIVNVCHCRACQRRTGAAISKDAGARRRPEYCFCSTGGQRT